MKSNNLQKSQSSSIQTFNQPKILASLCKAVERTGSEKTDIPAILKDVAEEFPTMTTDEVCKAIRKGSLGVYGKTYKLTTQEVCIWIREHKKSLPMKIK